MKITLKVGRLFNLTGGKEKNDGWHGPQALCIYVIKNHAYKDKIKEEREKNKSLLHSIHSLPLGTTGIYAV